MPEQTKKKKYPINRPNTSFAMKANLVQREPEFQKRWDKIDLYQRMRDQDHPAGAFVFHDGPPYANGDIHIGHLLNKVLKDLVVRTKTMAGYDVEFVPGWDCHGLPIEHKVLKEAKERAGSSTSPALGDAMAVRRQCKKYAEKYVKLQARQMLRLGTTARYDEPYITMDPAYEAGVLEVFADLVEAGLVYRALKPVHWSIANQTALADAELEYEDRQDTSVYVLFEISDPTRLPAALNAPAGEPVSVMIWTTTPWTLPANMAVAISEQAEYSLFRYSKGDGERLVLFAEELHRGVFEAEGVAGDLREAASGHVRLGTCRGTELLDAELTYAHPFVERTGPIVSADYVTLEDGTGMVHTATGHGVEDYQTGLRVGLETYCPVRADGTFDATVPDWLVGKSVWDANDLVVEHLRQSGHLFHAHDFMHSYPHDWRSKTPVIFRATEQWFISVDRPFSAGPRGRAPASLRDRALDLTANDIRFIPGWGRNRMRGMLDSRPDWCISRQRSWGLPIPAFVNDQGDALLTAASVRAVAKVFAEHGSDAWFKAPAEDLLQHYDPVMDPDAPAWLKSTADLKPAFDIFDVWFESGSSWHACMVRRGLSREEGPHTDLYLEGSDQHRGWFQLSLLPALGATGRPPYGTVLTHGFMVDKHGKKMSKSGGNAINVEDLMKDYGADVCRWWVANLAYVDDIKVDMEFFRLAGEEYRKVRNTIRFLLSNLDDFGPDDAAPVDDPTSVDAWVLGELAKLDAQVRDSYDRFEFRKAAQALFDFCNETLSAVYLVAVKDRLYCDSVDSPRRRRTQTAIRQTAEALIRLVAPILVHTGDEAYLALHGLDSKSDRTVHVGGFAELSPVDVHTGWPAAIELRDRVLKALEDAKQGGLDNPLDAGVTVMMPAEAYAPLAPLEGELADLCGVSRFELVENGAETIDIANLTSEPRCDRSWKRDGTVRRHTDADGDPVWLTDRDAEALGLT